MVVNRPPARAEAFLRSARMASLRVVALAAKSLSSGWVAEWSIAPVLKTGGRASVPGVQIPPHPPYSARRQESADVHARPLTSAMRGFGGACPHLSARSPDKPPNSCASPARVYSYVEGMSRPRAGLPDPSQAMPSTGDSHGTQSRSLGQGSRGNQGRGRPLDQPRARSALDKGLAACRQSQRAMQPITCGPADNAA